jgi:hypothetical protein
MKIISILLFIAICCLTMQLNIMTHDIKQMKNLIFKLTYDIAKEKQNVR